MNPIRSTLLLAATALALTLAACGKPAPVALPPAAEAPAASSAVPEVSDIDVTTRVKAALLRDDMTKGFEVAVVTTKGDVLLSGVLDNQGQIEEALRVVRATEGVHSVRDELRVKP